MKITNKNIIWIIIFILDICVVAITLLIDWNGFIWPIIAILLTAVAILSTLGLSTSFILDCLTDKNKFEYEIPIPFKSYIEDRKKKKKINKSIEDVKVKIAESTNDKEVEKLYIKLKVLQGVNMNEL